MSHEQVYLALEHLEDNEEFRDDDVDSELLSVTGNLRRKSTGRCTANLAEIPIDEWGGLRVSATNVFSDVKWDFQAEAGPTGRGTAKFYIRKNVSTNVTLGSPICVPLLRFIKALIYYNLPANALFVSTKSYNTIVNDVKWILELAAILYRKDIFVLKRSGKLFNQADSIVKELIVKELDSLEPDKRYGIMLQLKHWYLLSQSGYLPTEYSISKRLVTDDEMKQASKAYNANRDSRVGYLPIRTETLAQLIPACADMVEKHSADILFLAEAFDGSNIWCDRDNEAVTGYEQAERVIYAMIKKESPELWDSAAFYSEECIIGKGNKALLKKAIREHDDWDGIKKVHSGKLNRGTREDLKKLAAMLGINTDEVCSNIIHYDTKKGRYHFIALARRLRTACEIIIMFSTGMRIRELNTLKAGCARQIPGSTDHELSFYVHKTKHHATIPIPALAYRSVIVLEKLTRMTRGISNSEYLSVNTFHNNYGKERLPNEFGALLTDFCQHAGIEEHIHPHQFRKSIAMFFVYHDPCSLLLVKRLFSHRSLKMTLRYIVTMPGLGEEIKKQVIENNLDLLFDVFNAAEAGEIGGIAGKRFSATYINSKFKALLNDDGRENARMFVADILDNDAKILSRCSMGVICTKTHHTIADTAPIECDCDVVTCPNAIFTSRSIEDLEEEIRFHTIDIMQNPATKEDRREKSEKHVAACLARLAELKSSPPGAAVLGVDGKHAQEAA